MQALRQQGQELQLQAVGSAQPEAESVWGRMQLQQVTKLRSWVQHAFGQLPAAAADVCSLTLLAVW
jgi:hypothetical protein